ncbi:TatD family hydrolase [Paludibacterium paludis]|uniref:TatD related DNase n=1 Tax=Paludibacterium paludis TaxID=1225769 RepID=A0A918P2U1_9NEIS|nr:TatD family hydrolase [Paludibacterium paludis]GGY15346.1 TatD related DNase [Paludibacterium paludis]
MTQHNPPAARFPESPVPGGLIDSHCHLDAPEFSGNREAVVRAAQDAGIGQILVPAVHAGQFADTLAMRERFGCWIALGLHPIYLARHLDEHLDILETALVEHRPQALGEIGLDFFVPGLAPARQEWLFVEQLKLARRHDLPVIVHIRRSQDRVLKYLRQHPVRGGIAHAFNGSVQQAGEFLKLGLKLGFGGAMTYSGSTRIRALAATLPDEALVLETDAPDIPPEWAQNRPNQPSALARIAAVLAELRSTSPEAVAMLTARNTLDALGLPQIS